MLQTVPLYDNKYKARRIHFQPEIWTVEIGGIELPEIDFTCNFH